MNEGLTPRLMMGWLAGIDIHRFLWVRVSGIRRKLKAICINRKVNEINRAGNPCIAFSNEEGFCGLLFVEVRSKCSRDAGLVG
jgi:hypothetical protein